MDALPKNSSPLDLAIKHVAETRHLLETLVLSSESFDYPRAKIAVKELQKKSRELAKLQAELSDEKKSSATNVTFVPFRTET
jgi:hypothetical protein